MPDDFGFPTRTRIGTTLGNLEDTKAGPIVEFKTATETRRTLCGSNVAANRPSVVWNYPDMMLSGPQYHQLKKFVGSNMSASVIIQTPTQEVSDATFKAIVATYQATMLWPEDGIEETTFDRWTIEDGIEFTDLLPAS